MRKVLVRLLMPFVVAAPLLADYTVVLRDGTRYVARAKPTVAGGRATFHLKSGQVMQLDASLIDVAKSEQLTKLGVNANILDLSTNVPAGQNTAQPQPSLGSTIKLRPRNNMPTAEAPRAAQTPAAAAAAPAVATVAGSLPSRVLENFDKAYENVGIFEKKINSTGARSLRAELTVDTEERVFNAISATSFLMVKNAGVDGAQIDMVELFMKTTTGGSAGRFQMSRADADALESRTLSQHDYFIRRVIY